MNNGIASGSKVEKALRELNNKLAEKRASGEKSDNSPIKELLNEICFKFDLSPIEEEALRRNFS